MSFRRIVVLLSLAVLVIFPSSLSPQVPVAVSAGAHIGTIIKDAINVALPDATKLISALFGKDDKTKTTTKTAVTDAATKQAADAKTAADTKLAEIAQISNELNVVSEYLEITVPASQQVARLLSRLDNASAIPNNLKDDWGDIDTALRKLDGIKTTDLNKVDPGLRLRLMDVRGLSDANRTEILASIGNKDISGLRTQLRGIAALLNSVVSIAGIEIASLQTGLDSVTKPTNVKSQSGGDSDPRIGFFNDSLNGDLMAARRSLKRPYDSKP